MGIRDDLSVRNAEFVSLRELLEQLAAKESVTLQEAATWLLAALEEVSRAGSKPKWCEWTPVSGIRTVPTSDWIIAENWLLKYVATYGKFPTEQELDEYAIPF